MIGERIIGSVVGAGLAISTIAGVEKLAHLALGAPADSSQATTPMLLAVLAAWGVGVLVGSTIGSGIAKWSGAGWIVAMLIASGVLINAATIVQPLWLSAAGLALIYLAAKLGIQLAASTQRVAL